MARFLNNTIMSRNSCSGRGGATRGLLAQVETTRKVHWVHVRGHLGDSGNDRVEELVQWGKTARPYARLRALGAEEAGSIRGCCQRTHPI